jgi:hypothetical protein
VGGTTDKKEATMSGGRPSLGPARRRDNSLGGGATRKKSLGGGPKQSIGLARQRTDR